VRRRKKKVVKSIENRTRYPYYAFEEDEYKVFLEGRFWNQSGKQLAIIACVTKRVDWAAYIGTDAPNSYRENDTCKEVARTGCKLSEKDARYFFPGIRLPYRS